LNTEELVKLLNKKAVYEGFYAHKHKGKATMGRSDRKKASDVFRDTNYMFSKKVGFDQAFPEIEDLKVVVEQDGHGIREYNKTRHYGKDVVEYIDCSNSLCYNGGFSIGGILRDMVRNRETHREDLALCQGYEGSPKGRRRYRSCINSFQFKIDIKYKDAVKKENA
jgi:hypothetical protein